MEPNEKKEMLEKKEFIKPEIEVVEFESEDVIRTSGNDLGEED